MSLLSAIRNGISRLFDDGEVDAFNAAVAATEAAQADATQALADAATALATATATANGFDYKGSVRAVATSNITLSGTQTIDGVAVIAGNRVLAAGQTTSQNKGIYVVAAGAWSRAADADASAEVTAGLFVNVEEGTVYAGKFFLLTTPNPIVLGTTPLTFALYPPATDAASETTSGIAELATQAETNTGTDDARIVTPLKLATRLAAVVVAASETASGIAELATQAEVNTGTDAVRIVTPATLVASTKVLHPGVAAEINGLGSATPADADVFMFEDASAGTAFSKAKATLAVLATYVLGYVISLTAKTTPTTSDSVGIIDAAASNAPKVSTLAQIATTVLGYIHSVTAKSTPVGADEMVVLDSAASFAPKVSTITQILNALGFYTWTEVPLSAVASVTVTPPAISSVYASLIIEANFLGSGAGSVRAPVHFNSANTATDYDRQAVAGGNGSAIGSEANDNQTAFIAGTGNVGYAYNKIVVPFFRGATQKKALCHFTNTEAAGNVISYHEILSRKDAGNAAAVDSVTITAPSGTFSGSLRWRVE